MRSDLGFGEVEIRGKTWRWATVGRVTDRPIRGAGESGERVLVSFRDPGDPGREMRSVLSEQAADELTDERLRQVFERAWAVSA